MAGLLRMFRKKALKVAPEPEGSSCHLPQEQSGPSVPAGGEGAPGRTRRWKFPAFWKRKPAPGAGAEVGEAPARPKWNWSRMRLGRRDPAQERNRAGWLRGLLCGQQRPQEPSPDFHQEASPCLVSGDLPAFPGQEVEDPSPSPSSSARSPWDSSSACDSDSNSARSPWDSSSACDSDSSLADGRFCFVQGSARASEDEQEQEEEEEEEEWVDVVTEEAALKNIREQLQGREKDEAQQLVFLHAIHPACLAAQQRGQDTLEPRCCKAAVVERIVELIEELPDDSPPGAVLANCLIAVANLSTMTPALEPELETHLLRAALHAVFTLDTRTDTTQVQDLHRVMPDLLDAMLGNLLAKSPDTNKLHYILEHINYWMVSRVSSERARAIRSSATLLTSIITLPDFDNSAEFPEMGHHVAQLALSIGDPDKDISRQAREGVFRLYQLLLHQRDLTIHEAEELWLRDWHQDSRLLGYKNTARVGEVFGKLFSEGQRRFFLRTAVLAMHNPRLRVSQAGLLLTYSLLGQAQQLLGDKQEEVTYKVTQQLHIIHNLHQVPEAVQELCLRGHQLLPLPVNEECSQTEWSPSEWESERPPTRPLEGGAYIAPPPSPSGPGRGRKYKRPAVLHSGGRACKTGGRSACSPKALRGSPGVDEDWPGVLAAVYSKESEEAWRLRVPNPGEAGSSPGAAPEQPAAEPSAAQSACCGRIPADAEAANPAPARTLGWDTVE
ncbi:uncharacterized protein LOC123355256 [Mauremys mutica]|uniref:uncharacterized protein LOC123355256 n=1 Tax=Mauremys mutica TaxID=74926 RepID=UPI001D163576|nr:uncharacterized protein LOC123355256 [Mauremys mutica]